MKTAFGIIAGYAGWTVLWLLGNALLRKGGILPNETSMPIQSGTALGALIVISVICSLVAGYLALVIARTASLWPGIVLGSLLLATGMAVQWRVFNLMPLWYHFIFLGLVVPMTLQGARFAPRRLPAGR